MHSKVTGAQQKLYPILCLSINVYVAEESKNEKKKPMAKEIEINGNEMEMHLP